LFTKASMPALASSALQGAGHELGSVGVVLRQLRRHVLVEHRLPVATAHAAILARRAAYMMERACEPEVILRQLS
jgi:hypothetical protein